MSCASCALNWLPRLLNLKPCAPLLEASGSWNSADTKPRLEPANRLWRREGGGTGGSGSCVYCTAHQLRVLHSISIHVQPYQPSQRDLNGRVQGQLIEVHATTVDCYLVLPNHKVFVLLQKVCRLVRDWTRVVVDRELHMYVCSNVGKLKRRWVLCVCSRFVPVWALGACKDCDHGMPG